MDCWPAAETPKETKTSKTDENNAVAVRLAQVTVNNTVNGSQSIGRRQAEQEAKRTQNNGAALQIAATVEQCCEFSERFLAGVHEKVEVGHEFDDWLDVKYVKKDGPAQGQHL